MKKKLTIICCLASFLANSQYFEHQYGVAGDDIIGSGQFTDYTGKGHLMSGQHVLPNASELILVRTDQDGAIIPGPYFEKRYKLLDATSTIVHDVLQSRVVEFNTFEYGVVGVCEVDRFTGQQAVFFAKTDALGAPIFAFTYLTMNPSFTYDINAIRLADSGNEIYLCGMVFNTVQHYAVVMKLDIATGAIIWAYDYIVDSSVPSGEPEEAFDLIEYPATGELLVVGQRHVCSSTTDDGFIMHLNPIDGQLLNPTDFYGDPNGADAFVSIDRSSIANAFYVGGWTGSSLLNRDNWVTRFDNNVIIPTWSSIMEYSYWTANNYGIDILERINTLGDPILYSLARTETGILGQSDIEVDKLDALTGAALQQYTYGNIRHETPSNIHYYNSGLAGDGISVYSMREFALGNYDLMIHKAYFNGVTACNYDTSNRGEIPGPNYLYSVKSSIVDYFQDYSNNLNDVGTIHDSATCFAVTVTGGNNQFLSPNPNQQNDLTIEVKQSVDDNVISIRISEPESQLFSVELRDLKGALIHPLGMTQLENKETVLNFDLNSLNLPKGIYLIQWSNGTRFGSEKLIIR